MKLLKSLRASENWGLATLFYSSVAFVVFCAALLAQDRLGTPRWGESRSLGPRVRPIAGPLRTDPLRVGQVRIVTKPQRALAALAHKGLRVCLQLGELAGDQLTLPATARLRLLLQALQLAPSAWAISWLVLHLALCEY